MLGGAPGRLSIAGSNAISEATPEQEPRAASAAPDAAQAAWDAARVRALRSHLGESQQELAERLDTRQQTVSEWETGNARPRRMSRRLLHLVAEETGFYDASGGSQDREGSEAGTPAPEDGEQVTP